ncbi:MAG TPA: hypothetical protein VMW69_01165 [Spirochaetia bacterium]|nr:hypothetical protein [Spirochaetia bacterium]
MKVCWKVSSVVCVAALLFASCASYVARNAGGIGSEPAATIGVVVSGNSVPSRLSDLMVSSLKDRSFGARSISPSEILPNDLLKSVSAPSKYSFSDSFSDQLRSGGTIKGTSSALERLLLLNDVAESGQRYKDLVALRDAVLQDWKVDYVMFIYMQGGGFLRSPFSYSVRTIRTENREIVFTYYINANKFGWARQIPKPKQTAGMSISRRILPLFMINRRSDAVEIELCEHVADLLVSGRGK